MNVPDDLREMLNIASALKSEQERIKSTDEWVGIRELHGFYTTFTPSACVALIERIAALEAENARLSAPIDENECYAFQCNYGDHTMSRYHIDGALTALIAARKGAA